MIETIYVARHGFRMNWVTDDWVSKTGLPRDPTLAAFGETQAQELADYFASLPEDKRPTLIFSSPFYRTLQTADPIAKALNLPIYCEYGVSEWFSPVVPNTGLHPRPAEAAAQRAFFPRVDAAGWSPVLYPPRVGEDVEEIHARTGLAITALIHEIERRWPGQHTRILLVTHAATAIALARALIGKRELALRIGCCTVSEFVPKEGRQGGKLGEWEALRLGDGSFLKDGALRDWGFEDIELEGGEVIKHAGMEGSENDVDEPIGLQISLNAKM